MNIALCAILRKPRPKLALAISPLLLGATFCTPVLAQFDPDVFKLNGLDGVNGFRIDGPSTSQRTGRSVSAIGDLNGDGIGLIIGAASASFIISNDLCSRQPLGTLAGTND